MFSTASPTTAAYTVMIPPWGAYVAATETIIDLEAQAHSYWRDETIPARSQATSSEYSSIDTQYHAAWSVGAVRVT